MIGKKNGAHGAGKTPADSEAGALQHVGNPAGGEYNNPLASYDRGERGGWPVPTESSTTFGTPYGSGVATQNRDLFPPVETLLPPQHPHNLPPLLPSRQQLEAAREAVMVQRPAEPRTVRFGRLYDSLRTRDAWRYIIDLAADGTITPSTAAPVVAAITVPTTQLPAQALDQYPGAGACFAVVTMFSYAVTAAGMAGALVWYWLDQAGKLIPLIAANGGELSHEVGPTAVSKYRYVDPSGSQLELGSIYVKMVSGATPVLCAWQIGFSLAYLLPEEHPYDTQRQWEHIGAQRQAREAAREARDSEHEIATS